MSSGAACSSGANEPSHVLEAMGLSGERARASVRFSLHRHTTEEEIAETVALVGSTGSEIAGAFGGGGPMMGTIAVAMSGGVDSSAVAAMLKAEGHTLVGLTMQLWNQRRLSGKEGMPEQVQGRCCSIDDVYDARRVAGDAGDSVLRGQSSGAIRAGCRSAVCGRVSRWAYADSMQPLQQPSQV